MNIRLSEHKFSKMWCRAYRREKGELLSPSAVRSNSPQNVGTCLPYNRASHPKLGYLHSHRQENLTSHHNFPTTQFMLLDIAKGFKPVGLQTKNLRTFIIFALGCYQPLILWIMGTLLPRQADRIVKLHTHLHLVQQGWPTCRPQKENICGPRSPE
jgi:hypothetical protein